MIRMLALIVCALALAGCGALPPGASPGTQPPTGTGNPTIPPELTIPPDLTIPPEMSFPPELGEVPQQLFAQAAQEAAAIANVAVDEVSVVRAEAVTWSDSSLGCPEPGQMYTQVLTPGYWLVLEASGNEYDFRIGDQGSVRLCPAGQGQPPLENR